MILHGVELVENRGPFAHEFARRGSGRVVIHSPPRYAMTEHTKPVKTPDNWGADGMSKGKQTGPVRPTPDACRPKK